ncbi:hypothetical protein [Methanogenium organophilum]|uniref:Uncharacterized protein n=1 Tax=Methanogenium organophilum TaxID=2199 RepID=A0A9X9S3R1_METOG|nr:hypothetical protein [Methanogenium organophilum]WAI00350.1 hypothetical protein OU421_07875 [Methanogenium organophilum]
MKQIPGKKLKAADIAEMTGLSEEQVHDIAHRHGNRISSRQVGRIQVYDERAADVFTAIADEEQKKQAGQKTAQTRHSEELRKHKGKPAPASRLSSISKTREDENTVQKQKITAGHGSVPNHLIQTVAMQGQQFSRFADRITSLEEKMVRDREEFGERIDRLERQVAAIQEQMEAVDTWITHVDSQLDQNDTRITRLAEETHTWTEYVRDELAWLRLSWWKRRQQK